MNSNNNETTYKGFFILSILVSVQFFDIPFPTSIYKSLLPGVQTCFFHKKSKHLTINKLGNLKFPCQWIWMYFGGSLFQWQKTGFYVTEISTSLPYSSSCSSSCSVMIGPLSFTGGKWKWISKYKSHLLSLCSLIL